MCPDRSLTGVSWYVFVCVVIGGFLHDISHCLLPVCAVECSPLHVLLCCRASQVGKMHRFANFIFGYALFKHIQYICVKAKAFLLIARGGPQGQTLRARVVNELLRGAYWY